MLDEKDLQALSRLLDKKLDDRFDAYTQDVDAKLAAQTRQINLLIENQVTRKIDLLYEKADSMEHRLAALPPSQRVERLEEQMELISSVVKLHSREIEELKHAQ